MPPATLFDISGIDLSHLLHDQEDIRTTNPQRDEFEMLNGVNWVDASQGRIVGFKNVRADEFWTRGHIPGRPIFPGVLQMELAAQLAGFYTARYIGWKGFIGFGGMEDVRFRGQVLPGCKLTVLAQQQWARHRRISCATQGWVDGNLVFEATIIGVQL